MKKIKLFATVCIVIAIFVWRLTTVNYEGKKCTFKIIVNEKQLSITLNLNYVGAENKVIEATPDEKLEEPTAERNGYTLYGWYVDAACIVVSGIFVHKLKKQIMT